MLPKGFSEALMKEVEKSLKTDVTETIQAIQRNQIKNVVYNAYEPRYYWRRFQGNGLMSKDNIVGNVNDTDNGKRLTVENITQFNRSLPDYRWTSNPFGYGEYLTPLIVLGNDAHEAMGGTGYTFKIYGAGYMKPRDFISSTRNVLKSSNAHVNSLKKSLKNKGIEVK